MEPETLSQIGGARIGAGLMSFNATWPFAKLDITDSELRLTCVFQEWIFPKSSIKRLQRHRGVLSTGLRIEHTIATYNPFIVFWTLKPSALERDLKLKGYLLLRQF
jgi:hypothetical protein